MIGPDTVDTMPPATIDAFSRSWQARLTLERGHSTARNELRRLEAVGISMDEVTRKLQIDGVASFTKSFEDLIETISQKREEMLTQVAH